MPQQDSLTAPPFNAPLLRQDGTLSDAWRQWFEQVYEWEAPDPVQQLGIHFPLFPIPKLTQEEEYSEDPGIDWIRAIGAILGRLDDLESLAAELQSIVGQYPSGNIEAVPENVTTSRDIGVVYTNTSLTAVRVDVSIKHA